MQSHDPEQITFFAKTDARGQEVPFGIKAKDRTRHVYVIGKTGMGKSTMLENMAVQDIKNGNGLAFIDPHGQTAETLLNYIPPERVNDVLYFAPFDTNYPVSFNVMEDVGPDKRHLVVSGLMSVFKKIWVDAWSARMEYILSNTLLALLEYPDSTLLGINQMLSNKAYRQKVVDNITDPAVRSFWVDEFANYNERYMQEAGDAIKNKTGQFLSNPLIRNVIGQPKSSFDLRKMMDERKIIIMNLSKGLVGESNANLLGSMLTTRIYLAAMSRADLTQDQLKGSPNFYFYVDEFQSFANATFADILSEARKYKLNLTIAHQYIEQMEEEVRNAVFGNVGTTIAFRVGPFDAEVLESIFTPKFLAPDIVNLGMYQIYLTLMIDGIGSQPFSATTLPPIARPEVSTRDMVIAQSRKTYAHPRAGIETMIEAWHMDMAGMSAASQKKKSPSKSGQSRSSDNGQSQARPRGDSHSNNQGAERRESGKTRPQQPRSEKPKESATHSNQRPAKVEADKPKTADDLKAVLRNLVDNTNQGAKDQPPKNTNNPERPKERNQPTPKPEQPKTENKNQNQPSLRTALSEALAGRQTTDSAPPQKPETKEKETEATKTLVDAPNYNQPKTEDPLSPKKLERMMRVTGNDRTPLG